MTKTVRSTRPGGRTELNRIYHLDRGYERLTHKLSACGAEIERLSDAAAE